VQKSRFTKLSEFASFISNQYFLANKAKVKSSGVLSNLSTDRLVGTKLFSVFWLKFYRRRIQESGASL
jgi:hypothetical protein